jgi:hypothetical protein
MGCIVIIAVITPYHANITRVWLSEYRRRPIGKWGRQLVCAEWVTGNEVLMVLFVSKMKPNLYDTIPPAD